MNLFESIKSNLNESDFALDFEKNIPHHMRFKTWDIIDDPDRPKRYLYWVTQEPFDDLDIERFRDAFVDTGFSDAYVTVRDLSSYDFNSDKDEGVLVHISKDGTIDADDYLAKANDRGWFNESEELTESIKLNEGAQPFAQVGDGKYAKEVFNKLVDEANYEYGHDPYNGTISTTNFGGSTIKIADTYSEEADAKAKEYIENDDNGEKWVSKCLDLGELPDQPGVHRYVFYGWAAI